MLLLLIVGLAVGYLVVGRMSKPGVAATK